MIKSDPQRFGYKPSVLFKAASILARVIGAIKFLPIDFLSSGATARDVSEVAGPRPSTFHAPSN